MTIDKIFIPTVKRVNNQVTYHQLPDSLKSKVVMVVQEWERPQYDYPVEYLVLPSHIHYSDRKAIAMTREHIYRAGMNMKYAMLDDDVRFGRRNSKYWGEPSSMEKSKRNATDEDILEMFDIFDEWLNTKTVCGCSFSENPPTGVPYRDNTAVYTAWWINGTHFSHELENLDLTSVGIREDAYFMLQLLSLGYSSRVSQEFLILNESVRKKNVDSEIWNNREFESIHSDNLYIQKMFPDVFEIQYDGQGDNFAKEFRCGGKVRIAWNKAYRSRMNASLGEFLS